MKTHVQTKSLLAVYDDRVLSYGSALSRCQQRCDESAVHDLRVSIRRLLVMLDILRDVFPDLPRCRVLRRRLKAQLEALGPLRDAQVMLFEIRRWSMTRAAQAFASWVHRRELDLRERVMASLQAFPAKRVRRKLAGFRRRFEEIQVRAVESAVLWQTVVDAYECMTRCQESTIRGSVSDIHRVRIAFKRFRYTVEVVQAVDPRVNPGFLKSLRDWQTRLGGLQDAVVIEASFRVFAANEPKLAVFELLNWLAARREQFVTDYWRQRAGLTRFQLPVEKAAGV